MTAASPSMDEGGAGALAVLRNRPFLLLWLAQVATQIGGNMVLFGLTVILREATRSTSVVGLLILSFLVPAVVFSAVAGVYVDRLDRRLVLIATNVLRAVAMVAIFLVGGNVALILVLTFVVSTITVFFAPAEASMIPILLPRRQLLAANGLFTLTLNVAFAIGFALAGPFVVVIFGPEALILVVGALYFVAAIFCATLPEAPPAAAEQTGALQAVADAERAVESTLAELRVGLDYIRANPGISWSLVYLGIAASLVGVLGTLGPAFAETTLGLNPKDLWVVVLPLGMGVVTGILFLNSYGSYLPRRRVIEVGMVLLGLLLAFLSIAGPISQFLRRADASTTVDLSAVTSLIAVVVAIAFAAGIAYAVVAIPAQTQLQEDIPEEARGRIFGVLNMLVSIASFLPIIVVAPLSDAIGTTSVIVVVAVLIAVAGVASIVRRGPLLPEETRRTATTMVGGFATDTFGVTTSLGPPGSHEQLPLRHAPHSFEGVPHPWAPTIVDEPPALRPAPRSPVDLRALDAGARGEESSATLWGASADDLWAYHAPRAESAAPGELEAATEAEPPRHPPQTETLGLVDDDLPPEVAASDGQGRPGTAADPPRRERD